MSPKLITFGDAIQAMKDGECVQRIGWNGKGMFIYLEDFIPNPESAQAQDGRERKYDRAIVMYTAQKTHQPGWLASQADILADDWLVVNGDVIEAGQDVVGELPTP